MASGRDVAAFDARASRYDDGRLGRLHHEIAARTVEVALSSRPEPLRILDVGCGTGHLLRLLAGDRANAVELVGVDPAGSMIDAARGGTDDPRLDFTESPAERLPYPDRRFDLVVSTTSFDHWGDQAAGVAECTRVLAAGGHLVITDLFSAWLTPTLIRSRSDKARTKPRMRRLLTGAGLRIVGWHDVMPLIKTVVALRPPGVSDPGADRT